MGLKPLTFENLLAVDFGVVARMFDTDLRRMQSDMRDRPEDEKPRKVFLELTLTPVTDIRDQTVYLEGVKGSFRVRSSVPDHRSRVVDFGVKHDGSLYFSEEEPTNHRQGVLFAKEVGEERR